MEIDPRILKKIIEIKPGNTEFKTSHIMKVECYLGMQVWVMVDIQFGEEEVKEPLLANGRILHIRNPREFSHT